jgi:hypothetical protein
MVKLNIIFQNEANIRKESEYSNLITRMFKLKANTHKESECSLRDIPVSGSIIVRFWAIRSYL